MGTQLGTDLAGRRQWQWADAAARTAHPLTSADVGAIGYQTDIARKYELVGVSPTRWAPLPDPTAGPPRSLVPIPANGTASQVGTALAGFSGTITARNVAATNVATQLGRVGIVTAAAAGSAALYRNQTNQVVMPVGGLRWVTQITLGAVSASLRWFAGACSPPAVADVDPATFVNSLGIGRGNGEDNAQLYHNDGAGVATQVDLGAGFPAATLDSAYELELYTFDGTSWGYQVRNMTSNAVTSGTLSSNLPGASTHFNACYYVSNNADAVAVALDVGNLTYFQRSV